VQTVKIGQLRFRI